MNWSKQLLVLLARVFSELLLGFQDNTMERQRQGKCILAKEFSFQNTSKMIFHPQSILNNVYIPRM